MDNLGRRKTVEPGGCRSAIGADVSAVEEIVTLHIDGELFRHRNNVQAITGRAKYRADLSRAFLKSIKAILTMIENDAGKRDG